MVNKGLLIQAYMFVAITAIRRLGESTKQGKIALSHAAL